MRSLLVSLKETVALYAFNYFINRFQKPGLHFFDVFIIAQKSNFVQTLFQKPVFQSGNLFFKILWPRALYSSFWLALSYQSSIQDSSYIFFRVSKGGSSGSAAPNRSWEFNFWW